MPDIDPAVLVDARDQEIFGPEETGRPASRHGHGTARPAPRCAAKLLRLTDDEIERRYRKGVSAGDIAEAAGCDYQGIRWRLIARGVWQFPGVRRRAQQRARLQSVPASPAEKKAEAAGDAPSLDSMARWAFSRRSVVEAVQELERARKAFPRPFASAHEGYAVLKEEVEEMWDAIKRNDAAHARAECVQVIAMGLRLLEDCCDSAETKKS